MISHMGCGMSQPPGPSRGRSRQSRGLTSGQSHGNNYREEDDDDQDNELQAIGPPTLASLGYECRETGREHDSDEPGRVQVQYCVTQIGNPTYIMMLGCNLNNGLRVAEDPEYGFDELTLFIGWMVMDFDDRPKRLRPKPRDILVAMWVDKFRRSLPMLRRIYFQAVIESSTRKAVRDKVCPLIGVSWNEGTNSPWQQITLYQPGRSNRPGNDEAFEELVDRSKFVKLVASIPAKYPQMMRPGCSLTIAEINITPSYSRVGEQGAFDMEVVLEDGDASGSI